MNYEADLFGRVRRNVEAANASLQSSGCRSGKCATRSDGRVGGGLLHLARTRCGIPGREESVDYQRKALDLVRTASSRRHRQRTGGRAASHGARLDDFAGRPWCSSPARNTSTRSRCWWDSRASSFSMPVAPLNATPPPVPLGVPSDVLERRPDIATLEREIAYENAQVGLAHDRFLSACHPEWGWRAAERGNSVRCSTLRACSGLWAAMHLEPLLQGGRNRANLAAARAAYDEAVANYRQSVLTAFQQVEDGISNLSLLSQALSTQGAAVEDAQPRAGDCQQPLCRRRYQLSRRHYRANYAAEQSAPRDPTARPADGQFRVPGESSWRRLGCSEIKDEQVHPQAGQILQQ